MTVSARSSTAFSIALRATSLHQNTLPSPNALRTRKRHPSQPPHPHRNDIKWSCSNRVLDLITFLLTWVQGLFASTGAIGYPQINPALGSTVVNNPDEPEPRSFFIMPTAILVVGGFFIKRYCRVTPEENHFAADRVSADLFSNQHIFNKPFALE